MIIRRIQPHEGLRFRAVRLRALADSPAAFGSTYEETAARPEAYWEYRARLGAAGEESLIVVAEEGDLWAGVVGGFREEGAMISLISLWVDPAYRGQRLATMLVDQVVAWARHLHGAGVSLWVTEENAVARALYRCYGFRETGTRMEMPGRGMYEIEMDFQLS